MIYNFKQIGFLQELCNTFGDFKVARVWHDKDGLICWSKHRSVLECWHSDAGIAFLGMVNNRQVLPCEIILDLDNKPTEEQLHGLCDKLEAAGEHYKAYFTGSKGYHIHIWNKNFALWSKTQREHARKILIALTGADPQKFSEGMLIALEGAPHWRTGRNKTLIREYPTKKWEKS